MPYKTGGNKGQLTTAEIRRLIREHNKLYTIKIPPGTDREGLIKLIEKNGYVVDHKGQRLRLAMKNLERQIKLPPPPPKKTEEQKKEAKKIADKKKLEKNLMFKKKLGAIKQEDKPEPEKKKPGEDTEGKAFDERKKKIEKIEELKKELKKKKRKKIREINRYKPKPFKIKQEIDKILKTHKFKNEEDKKMYEKIMDVEGNGYSGIEYLGKDTGIKKKENVIIAKFVVSQDNRDRNEQIYFIPKPTFELKKNDPKPVKIEDSKKPPSNIMKIDDTNKYKIIKYTPSGLPVKDYPDINNIPVADIIDNLEKKKTPIFFPWSSVFGSEMFSLVYILKENKNDCSLPYDTLNKIQKDKDIYNTSIVNPNKNIKKYAKDIAEYILKCWENKKVVALPISIVQRRGKSKNYSYHANMLIFNPYHMTAEHFEPHGRQFHGEGKWDKDKEGNNIWKWKEVMGVNMNQGVLEINRKIKEELKNTDLNEDFSRFKKGFKYLRPADICPPKSEYNNFRGFQSYDKSTSGNKRMFDGVMITEQGGYCCMWSLFFLDLRLKTLKRPVVEVIKEATTIFKEKNDMRVEIVEFMRGLAKYSFDEQMKMVDKGLLTKEELIDFLGHTEKTKQRSLEVRKKYGIALKETLDKDFIVFSGKDIDLKKNGYIGGV